METENLVSKLIKNRRHLNVSADDLLGLNNEPHTIAAHFDGDEFTEDELDDIRAYAEFVKNRRNK